MIELLVVIGIIALLAGILLPVLIRAMRTGERTQTAALIQTVSVALDAFYNDHQEYPQVQGTNMGGIALGRSLYAPGPDTTLTGTQAQAWVSGQAYKYGEVVLDTTTTYVCITDTPTGGAATSNTTYWQPLTYADGADGPGFRKRGTQGTIYTYLQPDRYKIRGLAILDSFDNPVLYYPARPTKPNLTAADGYVSNTGAPLYNTTYAQGFLAQNNMRLMLGDINMNGQIDAGETPAFTGPYILWSAGPDAKFGPTATTTSEAARCDDVTNFR